MLAVVVKRGIIWPMHFMNLASTLYLLTVHQFSIILLHNIFFKMVQTDTILLTTQHYLPMPDGDWSMVMFMALALLVVLKV